MLNLNSVMIGTTNREELDKFYQEVFQKEPDMKDEGYSGWVVGNTFFNIGEHSEVNGKSKEPARIILNFETADVQAEFDRIKQIAGAEVIKEPYNPGGEGMLIATFADPDGNYFQLMTPWESK